MTILKRPKYNGYELECLICGCKIIITFEEYSNLECPFCKNSHKANFLSKRVKIEENGK